MRLRLTVALGLILILVAVGSVVSAGPVPIVDLASLTREADLIVAGNLEISLSTESTVGASSDPVRRAVGAVREGHLLKGASSDETITFDWKRGSERGAFEVGDYRVVFLKRVAGKLTPVDSHNPGIAALPGPPTGATPLERVVGMASRILDSTDVPDYVKRNTMLDLRPHASIASARHALSRMMNDHSSSLRWEASAALLATDDERAPLVFEEGLSVLASDEQGAANLRGALYASKISGGSAVRMLGRLVRHSSVENRRAAVVALGGSGNAEAVDFLGESLQDADWVVRLGSLRGLAQLTNQDRLLASEQVYKQRESLYLDYWDQWLSSRTANSAVKK
jgi:hypothetical protein